MSNDANHNARAARRETPASKLWVLHQTWNDLLFAHWPVAKDRLRELVPPPFDLDTYDHEAWVSVTPFRLTDMTPRGIPALPWISAFNEVNVRTYVVYQGIPGVYFFSLDADSVLAVTGARTFFHLPYFLAEMNSTAGAEGMSFSSCRKSEGSAELQVTYRPMGRAFEPAVGALDYWLTERYCLYTQSVEGHAYRVDIDHPPWQLHAAEAEFKTNTLPQRAGIRISSQSPFLHFARRQDVLTWAPELLP